MPKKRVEEQVETQEELTPSTPLEMHSPLLSEKEAEPALRVERLVESGTMGARMLPKVVGGVCEFCGPAEYDHSSPQRPVNELRFEPLTQMGHCKHYKGLQLRCSYCPLSSDWPGNIQSRIHTIYEYPAGSGNLIVHCDAMECRSAHIKRFSTRRNV